VKLILDLEQVSALTMMLTGRIRTSPGRMLVCCIDINMRERNSYSMQMEASADSGL